MKIHKEGRNILLFTPLVLGVILFLLNKKSPLSHFQLMNLFVVSIGFYTWIIYFFRDPYRIIHTKDAYILCPADGKIVDITTVYEPHYFKDQRIRISIFMSPFNVHVNRFPISGVIAYFKYNPGKFLVAFHPKSSTENEHTIVVIENDEEMQVLFKQIAGFMARRIKFYAKEGDQVQQGEQCGFIKFGSRVEIFLPLDADIKVRCKEKVKGGISVLAKI